ncbi:hypothetical protein C2845_PM13G22990 [Panicum miliaceum]|uniref:BTB domain-containing protein n=1 Tax=Panicum miliaceum TaxID=4540 RepID=A0A3L6RKS7_PANMI|nr:hypothetical protein C2845_PM13G22990 [Panicum miliaceum]
MLDSGFVEFKLDYSKSKDRAIGDAIYSGNFSAGGHVWRVKCYPRGHCADMDDSGDCLGHAYPPAGFAAWGWSHFVHRRHLGSPDHLAGDGRATFVCDVIVLRGGAGAGVSAAPAPPPPLYDVESHLGRLLDSADGSDVAFCVGGETFRAHRAVLAARSPVLRAELLGPMAEATMPTINAARHRDVSASCNRILDAAVLYSRCYAKDFLASSNNSGLVRVILNAGIDSASTISATAELGGRSVAEGVLR